MDPERFWELIEASRQTMTDERDGNMDRQVARLGELLEKLDPAQIVAFHNQFYSFVERAGDWNLWAVAYIIGEGCSDDWFDYFRFWLISLGRENYERALAKPGDVDQILEETRAEDIFFEQISYVAGRAYRERTGVEIPDPSSTESRVIRGVPWQDDAELRVRFPSLTAKYWE